MPICENAGGWTVENEWRGWNAASDTGKCKWSSPPNPHMGGYGWSKVGLPGTAPSAATRAMYKSATTSADLSKQVLAAGQTLMKANVALIDGATFETNWNIKESIEEFRERERDLITELTTLLRADPPDAVDIKTKKEELVRVRRALSILTKRLNEGATQALEATKVASTAYKNQKAMTKLAGEHLGIITEHNTRWEEEIGNNKRMIKITNYEHDRYSSHKNILKIIAYCSFFVLMGIFIRGTNNDYIGWTGIPIIAISIFFAVFFTSTRIWSNYQRDEHNWNKFNWEPPE